MNGMGRGVVPADHPLAFNAARGHAFARADLVVVVGAPLDFRLGFGSFVSARVVHVCDHASQIAGHVGTAAGLAGPLADTLEALAAASVSDRESWISELRSVEEQKRAEHREQMALGQAPIHPARVYGALIPLLRQDDVLVADGGDFASYAGKFVDVFEPGGWLDPGPYGCLGISPGYALGAWLLDRDRRVVVLLGDGAAGFSMGDWDTLVRFGVNVTMVCGNNGIWGLEKHPMRLLYGYDVAAELRPETRYDDVMRALGGHGELVREPSEIEPALRRALSTPGPSLVNVVTDPAVAYPRSSNLG
jgi:acetolactate synthase-1/2/3 large subunit